jgi:hypothetical protein
MAKYHIKILTNRKLINLDIKDILINKIDKIMKTKIILLLAFLFFVSCGFLPMDYNRGGAEIYGDKVCGFHYGEGKDGMNNKYKLGIQQYCTMHPLYNQDMTLYTKDLTTLKYEKCNSCDEFMKKLGYLK